MLAEQSLNATGLWQDQSFVLSMALKERRIDDLGGMWSHRGARPRGKTCEIVDCPVSSRTDSTSNDPD
jgi:hypothetical protein